MKIAAFLLLSLCVAIIAVSTVYSNESEGGAVTGDHSGKGHKFSSFKTGKGAGKKSQHDSESSKSGNKGSELHRVHDEEGGGKMSHYGGGGSHSSSHHKQGGGHHGAKYLEGAKRKKEKFEKGFAEKYHKDELNKHDSFFSDGEKTGSYNVFGKKASKYGSQLNHKHSAAGFKNLKSEAKHSKGGKKSGGHQNSGKKGYKSQGAGKSHYAHNEKHAKKGGKKGGQQFKYSHKKK